MKRNKARDMAIYLSRNHSGITRKELVVCIVGTTITMAYNLHFALHKLTV